MKVLVKTETWEGSIVAGGEHIDRCSHGDIISVKKKTWEDMKTHTPGMFELIAEEPELDDVKTKQKDEKGPGASQSVLAQAMKEKVDQAVKKVKGVGKAKKVVIARRIPKAKR